jgi:hypothetical protein
MIDMALLSVLRRWYFRYCLSTILRGVTVSLTGDYRSMHKPQRLPVVICVGIHIFSKFKCDMKFEIV